MGEQLIKLDGKYWWHRWDPFGQSIREASKKSIEHYWELFPHKPCIDYDAGDSQSYITVGETVSDMQNVEKDFLRALIKEQIPQS